MFDAAVSQKAGGRATRIGGTSGMEAEAKKLMGLVKELHAIMRVHLKSNPALHDAWKSAARLERDRTPEAAAPAPTDGSGGSGSGSGGTVVVS